MADVPKMFTSRALLLFILPSPLILKLIVSILSVSLVKTALVACALLLFYSAAYLTRNTLIRIYQNFYRNIPKNVKDDRFFAMLLLGAGVLLVSLLIIRRPIVHSAFFSALSMIGYTLVYGIKPINFVKERSLDHIPKATREAIEGAYSDLEIIEKLKEKLDSPKDLKIRAGLTKVIDQSYNILNLLSKTPEDASRARRFLSVYINRIKEILNQYIDLSNHQRESDFRKRIEEVLEEANLAFTEKKSKLLDDDVFKLDIQLEVLDEQIKKEG